MLGIDYSFARPGGAAIKAAGYQFVCRYLASSAVKRLTTAEADELKANGLALVVVFEDYENPKQNHPGQSANQAGAADANIALGQANGLGVPSDRPIYFAVDYDAPQSDQLWIDDYLLGAASVIGKDRVGIYSSYYVVKRCLDHATAKWAWQTVAWSGGQIDSRIHIYQNGQSVFNGGADIDEAKQNDYGQWPIEGVTMDDKDITAMYLAAGKSEKDATLPANLDYYRGKKPEQLANDLYKGNNSGSPSYFYKASHYDADVAAASQKSVNHDTALKYIQDNLK